MAARSEDGRLCKRTISCEKSVTSCHRANLSAMKTGDVGPTNTIDQVELDRHVRQVWLRCEFMVARKLESQTIDTFDTQSSLVKGVEQAGE
eukprot:434433-Hanusia_phi.AAC.3